MTITFRELAEFIERAGSPRELLVHPDDYVSGVLKFAHPGMRGHDDKGEYMIFLTTKIRPNPPIERQNIVDLSDRKLGWE